jgi:glycosyltransferase involved in cell wall biosynthesis
MVVPLKVVIVHDWLVTYAGAERVLEQMLLCYPKADILSTIDFLPLKDRDFLGGRNIKTTFIQKMPWARTRYRLYLPLMPIAIEQLDLSGYNLVISSSHAVAKGVLVSSDQLHVCLCYTPARYAWDLQAQYLKEAGLSVGIKSWVTRWLLHRFRMWDLRTVSGVDHFIAISSFIAHRIRKTYRRDSEVIFPPVDTDNFELHLLKQDYFVTASRLVPYKMIPLIVQAFAKMPDKRLIIIGDGPDFSRCKRIAGPNVELLGYQPNDVLKRYLQNAKAFVFAAEEDFGIAPLEAQACGTPVIAFAKGGATETLCSTDSPGPTAIYFAEQSIDAIMDAVGIFEQTKINAVDCRNNALRFSQERFRREFSSFVDRKFQEFQASRVA